VRNYDRDGGDRYYNELDRTERRGTTIHRKTKKK
jgi:hypothetical protein